MGPSGEDGHSGEEGAFCGAGGVPGRRGHSGEQGIPFLAPAISSCSGTRWTCQALWRVCGNGGVWESVGGQGAEVCVHVCGLLWVCGRLYVCRCGLWPCVLVCLDMDLCVGGGECRCGAVHVYLELWICGCVYVQR